MSRASTKACAGVSQPPRGRHHLAVGQGGRLVDQVAIDLLLDQGAAGQGDIPLADILGGGPDPAEGIEAGGGVGSNRRHPAIGLAVAGRGLDRVDVLDLRGELDVLVDAGPGRRAVEEVLGREIAREHGAGEAQRLDLIPDHIVVIGHAAGAFDGQAQQDEVGRAQPGVRPGLEQQLLVPDEVQKLGGLIRSGVVEAVVPEIRNSRRMLQQLEDRHLAPVGRQAGDVFRDGVMDVELVLLLQLEHGDRGEGLGDRADIPERLGRGQLVIVQVGAAIAG
jgi:hypothetical protein